MAEHCEKLRLTDRKRESILDAAIQEFCTAGYDNTSMDRIAEAANASKRTVYNHFSSKEDLFTAIVKRLDTRCNNTEEFTFDRQLSLESQLTQIALSYIEMISSEDLKDLARVILPRFLQTPQLCRQILGDTRLGEEQIVKWLKSAQRARQLKSTDPHFMARQFQGMLDTFAFWPQIIGGDPPLSKSRQRALVKSTVTLFLSHYARS